MKLTTKSEYSLLALIYIARHESRGYVKIEDICRTYDLSKKYLEQLFVSLRQAQYITTRRGANGGYKLKVAARQISVAQIIRLMDGALAPTSAVSKYFYEKTVIENEKKLMNVFRDIRDYISRKVESLTLADLV